MRNMLCSVVVLIAFLASGVATPGQDLEVPKDKIAGGKPESMMAQYWKIQTDRAFEQWRKEYESRKTPEQIAAYQKQLREKFVEAIGGLPERTPLNPQVTGRVQREGYRVEKIVFESQPKHFVSALCFVPEKDEFKPPYPGVLVPCGHSANGKAHDAYQSMGAFLALSGMVALVFDPIDQGERGQYLGEGGWPKLSGTRAHTLINVASVLLGRSTARFEIWDGMRAMDYLQSRPEVDKQRIGCTGNSGGGTQTSYLMALDDRIQAAAPSCYLCGFPALLRTIGPQDAEQNIYGQLTFGMDHADYLMMRAPTPILICTATKDFFDIGGAWDVFRSAKRLYTRMGFAERVSLLENDEGHNYNTLQREGAVRWLSRWLLHVDRPITEPQLKLLSEKEVWCTPAGKVMELPEARSVYDLNAEYEKQLAAQRADLWKSADRAPLLVRVRELAGIRKLDELPKLEVEMIGSVEGAGSRIERLLLNSPEGIAVPALLWTPQTAKPNRTVLYLHDEGKAKDAAASGTIEGLVRDGAKVLAVDLPGIGQTRSKSESKDVFTAYLLGRSYVGLQAEHVLMCAKYAQEMGSDSDGIELISVGQAGIPAIHAVTVEPKLFQCAKLKGMLKAWSSVIPDPRTQVSHAQIVRGALTVYDLPDLATACGNKLTLE